MAYKFLIFVYANVNVYFYAVNLGIADFICFFCVNFVSSIKFNPKFLPSIRANTVWYQSCFRISGFLLDTIKLKLSRI